MNKLLLAGLTSSLLLSTQVMAEDNDSNYSFSSNECSIDLNYSVAIENSHIRFINNDQTLVQINNQEQLFVKGKQINLTDRQQALVSEYAEQVNQQVPEAVNLAVDAVEIAFQAIGHVVTSISGEDSQSNERLDTIFSKIKNEVDKRFHEEDGNYYLAQQNFDEFDQFMEDEIEGEIEGLISESVGDLLIAVGTAMNNEEGDFEQKMEAFGERMETMGEEIEVAVEAKAEAIGVKAEELCHNLKDLDNLETELSNSVDELADFNLLTVSE